MATKQIPISSLTLGMYVTKLDIPWIDSPFLYHNVLIKKPNQIEKLIKAGVKLVTIDPSKGKDVTVVVPQAESVKRIQADEKSLASEEHDTPPESVVKRSTLDAEMAIAKVLMSKITALAAQLNMALEYGEPISSEQVHPFIDETLSSLARNENALTTLINMQRKDQKLANHVFAVFSLMLSLSIKRELDKEAQHVLGLAAFFHDVGWLKLPMNLLGKKSSYTPSEQKLIEQHIAIGQKTLLKQCDLPDQALRLIAEHHEYLDGSGYPAHLTLNQLQPLSKLFTVVVRYDELIHGLHDKPALTPHGALAQLFKEAKQGRLDEAAVLSLISLLSVYPVGSIVQLSSKEKARVIEINPEYPRQPKVKIYYDLAGVAHVQPKIFDLSHQSLRDPLEIVAVLDINDPKVDPAHVFGLFD
jgi:HD-GYP domain-containing protein (c-di-GMP phosphodiesterase class II)